MKIVKTFNSHNWEHRIGMMLTAIEERVEGYSSQEALDNDEKLQSYFTKYRNYTPGINTARIIDTWERIALLKDEYHNTTRAVLYKKDSYYIIIENGNYTAYNYIFRSDTPKISPIKPRKKPVRNCDGSIVDSGVGFKMKDTKENWAIVDKYGYDAIEKVK